MAAGKKAVCDMTADQKRAARRKVSFGIVFFRSKAITTVRDAQDRRVDAPNAGKDWVISTRRFGSLKEASHHGKRFKRIEKHEGFAVLALEKAPNAWVNWKTGKTNPLIGRKRTNRR